MDRRFPQLRHDGVVVAGSAHVYVGDTNLGEGITPFWYDSRIAFKGYDNQLYTMNADGSDRKQVEGVPASGVTTFAAGGGTLLWTSPERISVAVSREGKAAWVIEHNREDRNHSIFVSGQAVIEHSSVNFVKIEGDYVVWSLFDPREVWGCKLGEAPRKLLAGLSGVPVVTPHGPWVIVQTNIELRIAPWGSTEGYIIATGEDRNFDPDALWINDKLVVVWSTNEGQPGRAEFTLQEPRVSLLAATPQPTPEPTPQPTPTPEEPMPEPRPLYEEVKAERAKYGTPMTPTELGILLNTVAWNARDEGWGLSAKPGGHNVPSPAGVKIAQDILHHKPTNTLYDVLGSGETLAIPAWGKALYHGDPEGRPWVAPVRPSEEQPEPEPEPEPIPEPEPKPKPECECSKELAGLKETIAVIQLAIKAHSDQIVELQSKTPTVLKAKGTTSKAWGHVHQVELTLTAE